MIAKPKIIEKRKLDYFQDRGTSSAKLQLFNAVYYDRTKQAIQIIREDPEQINQQDPFAGLTALHISIFRQNVAIVTLLSKHPITDLQIRDNFNRRASDMLDYTTNQAIFELLMDATYPDEINALEDLAFEEGINDGVIVPFNPKQE